MIFNKGLGIRVGGVLKNESKSPNERLHADVNASEEFLSYQK